MRHFLIALVLFFSAPIFMSAQTFWIEYQNNYKFFNRDSVGSMTHTLQSFYQGKEIKHGFSMSAFALVTKGWGEVLLLPTWTKQTKKSGLFSLSLGTGLETFTAKPRLAGSVFWLKGKTEAFFYWEQGTDSWHNNWHLAYLTYKLVQHEEGPYCTIGIHSQRGAVHGLKMTIGSKDEFEVWIVLGKPTLKQKSTGALIGLRKFF